MRITGKRGDILPCTATCAAFCQPAHRSVPMLITHLPLYVVSPVYEEAFHSF